MEPENSKQDGALHLPQLREFLERMLGQKDAAEEIALRAYREVAPAAWAGQRAVLFDLATTLAIAYLKAQRAGQQAIESKPLAPEAVTQRHQLLLDKLKRLPRIIEVLDPQLRQAFVMRFSRRMSLEAIAADQKVGVADIELRLHQALSQCRQRLPDFK